MQKEAILVLCGGKSAEHEISLLTATNILKEIDSEKYDVHLVCVTKEGHWLYIKLTDFVFETSDPKLIEIPIQKGRKVTLLPACKELLFLDNQERISIDLAFPVIHGTTGEDGCLQGYLNICGVPFVGSDVLGSAVGMDKIFMKRILRDANILNADFMAYKKEDLSLVNTTKIIEKLSLPVYVKPANMGSSIGVTKVEDETRLMSAIEYAFNFDSKVLIEEEIKGREIEVAVIGNNEIEASLPGEVLTENNQYYSFEEKYLKGGQCNTACPASLDNKLVQEVQKLAKRVFKLLDCRGLARVDFFISVSGRIYINEINTIPGFTQISMYPQLFMLAGLSYQALIDKLIKLAKDK